MELQALAILPLDEAKRLQDQLLEKGVKTKLEHNESTCTRGCSITVEFHADPSDIEVIQLTIAQNMKQSLEGHDVDWSAMSSTFNPDEKYATCPACSTEFETSSSECPECGLVLG